ncbi:MAG: chemotaxis protein CheW [SAR324 cluster bacterium]|nr:chemotaxis protein CheW [SAR324 cluster bacterium]
MMNEHEKRVFVDSEGKLLTFKLGNQEYGIPILEAREVIGMVVAEPIPKAPDFMEGVINLRGRIFPVIDLRTKFGMTRQEPTDESCIVLVKIEGHITGMIVDFLAGVATLEENQFEVDPDLGAYMDSSFLLGIAKFDGRVVFVLNLDEVLSSAEITMIQGHV